MLRTTTFPDPDELPPVRPVTAREVAATIAGGPRLVVLDDAPTGTQTVAGVPVLTPPPPSRRRGARPVTRSATDV
jgi:hypothetical protein